MELLATVVDARPLGASVASPRDAGGDEQGPGRVQCDAHGCITQAESSDARGMPIDKRVQVEAYDLDGITVKGLRLLCARFGLRRNGLRGELIVRLVAELNDRGACCAESLARK